jgi:hypothetical protein
MDHPNAAQKCFFEKYVFEQKGLLLTMKTPGCSVNIDGRFEFKTFKFRRGRTETVIQPDWATERVGANETNVHMHVQWQLLNCVRIWHVGTPHIDQDARICFFDQEPKEGERGEELFWFYTFREGQWGHPLCRDLPARYPLQAPSFSKAVPLNQLTPTNCLPSAS